MAKAQFTIKNRQTTRGPLFLLRLSVALIGLGACSAALLAAGLYTASAHDLPRLDRFERMMGVGITRFEAADGSLVAERYTERRLALGWEDLPQPLILAFLAAEDARFFEHSGLDFRSILRAMVTNFTAGSVREGASTITQQLAKILVGSQRTWSRKIKEAILARRMEDIYSKQEILTWYINTIFYGRRAYGAQAAAQNYFRKDVWDLSLMEMALIAASVQSPSIRNPAADLAGTRQRAEHILKNMVLYGWLDERLAEAALLEDIVVAPPRDLLGASTPQYTEAVQRLAPTWSTRDETYAERGLTIRMGVDPAAQRLGSQSLNDALQRLQRRQGFPGPLAHLSTSDARAAFFDRNLPWLEAALPEDLTIPPSFPIDRPVLALVTDLTKTRGTLQLSPTLKATLPLKPNAWAAPWTVFDKKDKEKKGKLSFDGKLRDLKTILKPGDVVLVTLHPGTKKDPTPVAHLVPIPMMQGALASTPLAAQGIDTLIGGWDYDRSQLDRTRSLRPTGSTMKPIAYALAYDRGLAPSAAVSTGDFREGKFTMRSKTNTMSSPWEGLIASNNLVSLRVFVSALDRVDKGGWQAWGERLGLAPCTEKDLNTCPLKAHADRGEYHYLAEVLGADQRPRDMLRAFATFAREGKRPDLHLVLKVHDRHGEILESHLHPAQPWLSVTDSLLAFSDTALHPTAPDISPTTAYILSHNLKEAVRRGTGRKAADPIYEAAVKTGTLPFDVWISGFTGQRATTLWVGADRNERTIGPSRRLNRFYGADLGPSWRLFNQHMSAPPPGQKPTPLSPTQPSDVVLVSPDGKAAPIPHRRGTEPPPPPPAPLDDSDF